MNSTPSVQNYYALTRQAFDRLARFYDLATLPLAGVRRRVAKLVGLPRGSIILDVATGTGQQAFAFARQGYIVVAVDLTDSMLQVASRHNRTGLVRFELVDATRLAFPAETFDLTSVSFALHDMPAGIREQVLKEMRRVTIERGQLIIVDYALPHNGFGRWLAYRLVSLYEAEYYREFIHSDLLYILESVGIRVEKEYSVLLGAARIWKCVRI